METSLRDESGVEIAATPSPDVLAAPVFGRRNLAVAIILFVVALVLLWAFEVRFGIHITGVSGAPDFIYQAESFLHGRWDLAVPATTKDVEVIHGKVYIYYPPTPALVMLPFVALFGRATSDILITTVVSACNLPLLYLLFEQVRANGLTRRIWLENLIISVLLYLGSINLWLSLGGSLWFTTHIVCMFFTLLSLLVAFRRHYGWSALFLGLAIFSRYTLVLGIPFLFYLAWQDAGTQRLLERFLASLRARQPDWGAVPFRRLTPVVVGTAVVLVLYLAHNAVLTGSPLDAGYDALIRQRYPEVKGPLYAISYIPANVIRDFFTFPRVIFHTPFDRHPSLDMLNGGQDTSVFLTTPLFLLLFWRNRRFSLLRAALWVTIGLGLASMLPVFTLGWVQFGGRYLYDWYPYAFLLLALNEVRVDWRFALLGLVAIPINALGASQFWTGRLIHL